MGRGTLPLTGTSRDHAELKVLHGLSIPQRQEGQEEAGEASWQSNEKLSGGAALPHEKSAFGLFTNLPPLEVVSNFATRSPLGLCTFAQRTEVAILRSLRQIVHEASGGAVVVLAEQFRIGLFQGKQTWEQE
jgi:hypothetical protein